MDNTNSGNDINLDPSMITSQGQTPQVVTPIVSVPVSNNSVIDITPGRPNNTPVPDVGSIHIDQATPPNLSVIDITPSANPTLINSLTPTTDPVLEIPSIDNPTIIETTPVSVIPTLVPTSAPVDFSTELPTSTTVTTTPVLDLPLTTSMSTPSSSEPVTAVAPIENIPTITVQQNPNDTVGFKVDTSSPLYEDPDQVTLAK